MADQQGKNRSEKVKLERNKKEEEKNTNKHLDKKERNCKLTLTVIIKLSQTAIKKLNDSLSHN